MEISGERRIGGKKGEVPRKLAARIQEGTSSLTAQITTGVDRAVD